MKRILTVLTVISFFIGTTVLAQSQVGPAYSSADAAEAAYNKTEITELINDRINHPRDNNAYIQFILDDQSFPAQGEKFKEELSSWVSNNPQKIEQMLIARKKHIDEARKADESSK